ncbi:OmpA family protein [Sinomicrobium soli]|uniref:OmpA family protein n=1 Tax=Sinomicrobium sp. N-1-3-6 TaxID=2219864 RepID=UPI00191BEE1E|nr:OmpA family protein [Sinomicrobium sp. N-1-3-6]
MKTTKTPVSFPSPEGCLKAVLPFFLILLLFPVTAQAFQRHAPDSLPEENVSEKGFRFGLRAGYDIVPEYHNNTPHIDYQGGLYAGLTAAYYWKWLSAGLDVDYIRNSPDNRYPSETIFDPAGSETIDNFALNSTGITRLFYGIGPGIHYTRPDKKFSAELNGRAGFANISGGELSFTGNSSSASYLLNYHAGYDVKNVLTAKGSLGFTYNFSDILGVHIGAYYMRHFGVEDLVNSSGYSAAYRVTAFNDDNVLAFTEADIRTVDHSCNCDISSIGAYAGLTLRLPSRPEKPVPPAEEACNTCTVHTLTVTAYDKYTGEILPGTEVAVSDRAGGIVRTGVTNSFGIVVFDNIAPGDYAIAGKLYGKDLSSDTVLQDEFAGNPNVQKEILYTDTSFILQGNAVICNTETPLPDVTVVLRDKPSAVEKNTLTGKKGTFIFHLDQKSEVTLFGRKQHYFSQMVHIAAGDYDRNTTLFVKLEMCMDEANCNNAIRLDNIHYDLDKYFIRDDAKPELDRLVQFMLDNPGIRVELSSHTDSRASHAYNQRLSQNRANAAREYLISKGIDPQRIEAVGYGETRLLNRCADGVPCSEAEHQLNRRTEMKVICPE